MLSLDLYFFSLKSTQFNPFCYLEIIKIYNNIIYILEMNLNKQSILKLH